MTSATVAGVDGLAAAVAARQTAGRLPGLDPVAAAWARHLDELARDAKAVAGYTLARQALLDARDSIDVMDLPGPCGQALAASREAYRHHGVRRRQRPTAGPSPHDPNLGHDQRASS